MKKTYIAPDVEILNIGMEEMIAASDPKVFTDPVDAGDADSRDILFEGFLF